MATLEHDTTQSTMPSVRWLASCCTRSTLHGEHANLHARYAATHARQRRVLNRVEPDTEAGRRAVPAAFRGEGS
jgi:hypothetical protein